MFGESRKFFPDLASGTDGSMALDTALTGMREFLFLNSSISKLRGITAARDSISSAIDLLKHEQSDLFGSFVILIPE